MKQNNKFKHLIAFVLTLVVCITSVMPAYALSHTHSGYVNGFFVDGTGSTWANGNIGRLSLTNRYRTDSGKTQTGYLQGITAHFLGGDSAFCVDPLSTSQNGTEYVLAGTASTANSAYWQKVTPEGRRWIAAAVKYYMDNPKAYPSEAAWAYKRAKIGAQIAIFDYVCNTNKIKNAVHAAGSTNEYNQVYEYALAVQAYADAQVAATPTVNVGTPSFNGNYVELTYNAATQKYTGSVTDTTGALSVIYDTPYDFTYNANGIVITRSGNRLNIEATQAAVDAYYLTQTGSSNTWSLSSTATDSVADNINMNAVKVYYQSGKKNDVTVQNVVVWEYDEPGDITKSVTATLKLHAESIVKGGVTVTKTDAQTGSQAQGSGTLAGIVFSVSSNDSSPIQYNGHTYNNGDEILTITTNANGVATTGQILPAGSYAVTEKSTGNTGYVRDTSWRKTFTISSDGYVASFSCANSIMRAGISVQKKDATTGQTTPQGNATFAGTVFSIANANTKPVYVNGIDGLRSYANGEEVLRITADANGYAATANNALPIGKYTVTEVSTASGSGYGVNSGYSATVTLTSAKQNTVVAATQCGNSINILGGVTVRKTDAETGTTPQGSATFEGAKFDIINKSTHAVYVGGKLCNVDEVVATITTDASGVATSGKILPKGKYKIVESSAPQGYQINTEWSKTFTITTNEQVYNAGSCADTVIAADEGRPGGGGGFYGGTIDPNSATAGGGSGYVGTGANVISGSTSSGSTTRTPPDGSNDGYAQITLILP